MEGFGTSSVVRCWTSGAVTRPARPCGPGRRSPSPAVIAGIEAIDLAEGLGAYFLADSARFAVSAALGIAMAGAPDGPDRSESAASVRRASPGHRLAAT